MPFADQPYESKSEEETDDESYLEDGIPIEIDSDFSAALSMIDDDFETTNPIKTDQALQEITEGLHQAANEYEKLRSLLPTIPITEVAEIIQAAPTPYLQPMSKTAVQALQTSGETQLINQACILEHQAGASLVSLMYKYGIGRDILYKALHGGKFTLMELSM